MRWLTNGRRWLLGMAVEEYGYPTSAEVYREETRVAREDAAYEQQARQEPDRGVPGLLQLPAATAAAETLMGTAGQLFLLHGDFISKNLVDDASSPMGWVALDPLP